MSELKPCPFCGSEAKRWSDLDHREQCVRCGALGPEYGASDAGWNTRVSPWRSLKDDPPSGQGAVIVARARDAGRANFLNSDLELQGFTYRLNTDTPDAGSLLLGLGFTEWMEVPT